MDYTGVAELLKAQELRADMLDLLVVLDLANCSFSITTHEDDADSSQLTADGFGIPAESWSYEFPVTSCEASVISSEPPGTSGQPLIVSGILPVCTFLLPPSPPGGSKGTR